MSWDLKFYKQQTQVGTVPGDIVICQEFSNYELDLQTGRAGAKAKNEKNMDNFFIRTGQAVGSWMVKSSSNSEHAAIVTNTWDQTDSRVAPEFTRGRICDANRGIDENDADADGIAIRKWRPRPA